MWMVALLAWALLTGSSALVVNKPSFARSRTTAPLMPSRQDCVPSEATQQSLRGLYESTGGESWHVRDNWLTNTSVCSWYGIQCNEDCTLGIRFLQSNNLRGTLPATFPATKDIVGFSTRMEPGLSGVIPEAMAKATFMSTIELESAPIQGTIPPALFASPSLQSLILEDVKISGTIPGLFAANLTNLVLGGSLVSSLLPSLSLLTKLQEVSIHDMPLVSGTLPSLVHMNDLVSLGIYSLPLVSGTIPSLAPAAQLSVVGIRDMPRLTGTISPDLVRCPLLSRLFIYNVRNLHGEFPSLENTTSLSALVLQDLPRVTGSLPARLAPTLSLFSLVGVFLEGFVDLPQSPGMEQVQISSSPHIRARLDSSYCQLTSLVLLQYSSMLLSGTIPDCLARTPLTQIWLTDGGLSGTIPASLGSMPLAELQIQNQPALSGTIPASFSSLHQLRSLFLFGNPLVSGTLPCLRALHHLQYLQFSNFPRVSGHLPDLSTQTQLQRVYIYSMPLVSGPIPNLNTSASLTIATLSQLPLVYGAFPSLHPHNTGVLGLEVSLMPRVSGTLPSRLTLQSSVVILKLRDLSVSGTLPALPAGHVYFAMTTLDLSNTMISGTVDEWLGATPQLNTLSLSQCRFSGTVPAVLGSLSELRQVNVNGNSFSALPRAALLGPKLLTFQASANLIPYDPRQCLNAGNVTSSLAALSLAKNPLNSSFTDVLSCYMFPTIQRLDISMAGLHGEYDPPANNNMEFDTPQVVSSLSCLLDDILTRTQSSWFQLSSLDLSWNQISGVATSSHLTCDGQRDFELSLYAPLLSTFKVGGTLVHFSTLPLNLQVVDISYSNTDPCLIPKQLRSPVLQTLIAPGVSLDCQGTSYSDLVDKSADQVTYPFQQLTCPQWVTKQSRARLTIDSSFNGYVGCRCPDQHFFDWSTRRCLSCPQHLICDPGAVAPTHRVQPSFYPIFPENCQEPRASLCVLYAVIEPCRGVGTCAVSGDDGRHSLMNGYYCASGFDPHSLLCSRCLPGYFKTKNACLQCHSWYTWFTPLVMCLVMCLYFYYLWRAWLSQRTKENYSNHAVVMITVGWLQLLELLDNRTSFSFLTETAAFKPWALQCVWGGFDDYERLLLALLLPFLLTGLIVVVWPTVMLLQNALWHTSWSLQDCRAVITQSVVRSAYFLYLPVTVSVFLTLNCTRVQVEYKEQTTTVNFLDRVPHIQCHDPVLMPLAVVSLIYFVVGLPMVATISMWQQVKTHGRVTNLFRSQVDCCRESKWWWVCFTQLRTLVVVGVFYLSPYDNSAIPILIFLMVMVSILLQLTASPHVRRADNVLSTITLLTLLIEYLSTIISPQGSSTGFSSAENIIVSSVTILCVVVCALFSVRFLHDVVRTRMLSHIQVDGSHQGLLPPDYLHDDPTPARPYTAL